MFFCLSFVRFDDLTGLETTSWFATFINDFLISQTNRLFMRGMFSLSSGCLTVIAYRYTLSLSQGSRITPRRSLCRRMFSCRRCHVCSCNCAGQGACCKTTISNNYRSETIHIFSGSIFLQVLSAAAQL